MSVEDRKVFEGFLQEEGEADIEVLEDLEQPSVMAPSLYW